MPFYCLHFHTMVYNVCIIYVLTFGMETDIIHCWNNNMDVVGLHLVQNLHVFSIHSHKAQTSGLWLYDSVMVCIVNMLIVKTVTHIAL